MVKAIPLLILLFLLSPSYGMTIYHWVDNNGICNFTDDYEKVPSAYRNQVRLKGMEDVPEVESPVPPTAPKVAPQKEEIKRDIFGQGEEWWKEKVRPWERQLKGASENYQMADEEFLKESDKLMLRKYGSHQQFKSTILGTDRIREERTKYEAKIIEAEGMLKKISREAEESKADFHWLTGASALGQAASSEIAEKKTNTYEGDEAWWRKKLLTQKQQLQDAIENYEKAYVEYSKNVETLDPSRFGGLSLTQYQMASYRLDILNNEMARSRVQVTEVIERLKKLVKEAEEYKVNPDWIEELNTKIPLFPK